MDTVNNMNKYWIRCALIRAVKTIAQTAVATIGSAAVLSSVDWKIVASASVLAGILSLLTSVAGLPEVDMLEELDGEDVELDEEEEAEEEEAEEDAEAEE